MSMAMDFIGRGIQQYGTDMQLGGNLAGSWGKYIQAKAQSSMMRLNAEAMRIRAGELDQDAKSRMVEAGEAQMEGREAAAIRGLHLAQDVGRVWTGAAGAGIDVSSATARHVAKGMRQEGYRDMAAITANAASAAQSRISEAVSARKNAIWQRYDARVTDINAKLVKKAGKLAMIGGIMSAVGQHMGQTAQNWGPGQG